VISRARQPTPLGTILPAVAGEEILIARVQPPSRRQYRSSSARRSRLILGIGWKQERRRETQPVTRELICNSDSWRRTTLRRCSLSTRLKRFRNRPPSHLWAWDCWGVAGYGVSHESRGTAELMASTLTGNGVQFGAGNAPFPVPSMLVAIHRSEHSRRVA
jgi:hypothetical protein